MFFTVNLLHINVTTRFYDAGRGKQHVANNFFGTLFIGRKSQPTPRNSHQQPTKKSDATTTSPRPPPVLQYRYVSQTEKYWLDGLLKVHASNLLLHHIPLPAYI